MASKRQNEANRGNARQSTGPKTEAGKARASRNSRLHGLSQWQKDDDEVSIALAAAIASELACRSEEPAAVELARAKTRLGHIRKVRHTLLTAVLEGSDFKQVKRLAGLERYEKAARAKQRRELRRLRIGRAPDGVRGQGTGGGFGRGT